MTQKGRARRRLIARLVPRGRHVIDVGADHGMVADSIGAIATERMPHRRGSSADRTGPAGLTWVIADGLAPFRTVDVAIIAGMGSKTIEGILTRGPTPTTVIVHAPDDPQRLRGWLADNGWRIDSEGLAPEGNRFAEVIRAERGAEPATGLRLEYGPILLESEDPHLRAHLTHHLDYHQSLLERIGPHNAAVSADSQARVRFLKDALQKLW